MIGLTECLVLTSGYVASLASNVLATLGGACAQALQQLIPTFQLNLSRYIFQICICGIIVLVRSKSLIVNMDLVPYVLLAGLFSNIFNITYYTASALLPLGTLLVVTNIMQIVNSTIINKIVFKKMVVPLKFLFIAFMVVGLVLILQPRFIFHGVSIGAFDPLKPEINLTNYNVSTNLTASFMPATTNSQSKLATGLGYILAVSAGIASTSRGAVYRAKLPSLSMGVIGFWVGVLGVVPSLVLMFYLEEPNVQLSGTDFLLLFGHGFGAASYSTLNIYAQQKLTPVTWAMMDNTKLILNFISQYTLLSHILPGKRNAIEVLGGFIALIAIIGSVLIDIRADSLKEENVDEQNTSEEKPTDMVPIVTETTLINATAEKNQ